MLLFNLFSYLFIFLSLSLLLLNNVIGCLVAVIIPSLNGLLLLLLLLSLLYFVLIFFSSHNTQFYIITIYDATRNGIACICH